MTCDNWSVRTTICWFEDDGDGCERPDDHFFDRFVIKVQLINFTTWRWIVVLSITWWPCPEAKSASSSIPLLITLIYKMYIEEDCFLISLNTIRLIFATSGVISLPKPRDAKLSGKDVTYTWNLYYSLNNIASNQLLDLRAVRDFYYTRWAARSHFMIYPLFF